MPRLAVKLAPYKAIAELERAQELLLNVTADGTLGEAELHTVVPVEVRSDGSSRITRVTLENVPLYYSNGMLIIENGKAYGLGGCHHTKRQRTAVPGKSRQRTDAGNRVGYKLKRF